MLIARGDLKIGVGHLHWAFAFSRRVRVTVTESDGLRFDTRFVPGAPGPPKPNVCLYLLVDGCWRWVDAPAVAAPAAIAMSLEQLEGANQKRPMPFTSSRGFRGIEIHFRAAELRRLPPLPGIVELDSHVWEVARRVTLLSQADEATVLQSLRQLLQHLSDLGLWAEVDVDDALTVARPVERLWRAVKPMVERAVLVPTLGEMSGSTGLSTRLVDREMRRLVDIFGLVGPGLRSVALRLRLKTAVMFLSAEGASVSDVARAVGYSSVDAMSQAFRLAGLAAPSVIQQELRASEESSPSRP